MNMMNFTMKNKLKIAAGILTIALLACGCVNQHPKTARKTARVKV
ncbi:MAG: hypothetical protein ACLVI9_02490 [Anaerostipes hadrus]